MPGTLTHSPADIVRYLLVDLGFGSSPSGTADWPIYCSSEPDSPDNLITTIDMTGVHQGRLMVDGEVQERHGVQILIRNARFVAGWLKSRQIAVALDAVYQSTVVVGAKSYLVHAITRSSGPLSLGMEAPSEGRATPISKRETFSVNCTVSVREVS
jgi:hypothetical protein